MRWVEAHQFDIDTTPAVPDPSAPSNGKADLIPDLVSFDAKSVVLSVPPFDAAKVNAPAEARIVAFPSGSPDMTPGEAVSSRLPQTAKPLVLSPFGSTFQIDVPAVEPGKYTGKVYVGFNDDAA